MKGLKGKGKPAVVGVLKSLSVQEALRAKESGADAVELRIDLLNLDLGEKVNLERGGKGEEEGVEKVREFVARFKKEGGGLPIIATNRRKEEGGSFGGTEEERVGLLTRLLETAELDAVDIEFFAPEAGKKAVLETARRHRRTVILSFHDFTGMPSREEILEIVARMHEEGRGTGEGGCVAKIAVTPRTLGDALFLLDLTYKLSSEGKAVATIGMGAVGRHLRVVAPLYGSALTYGFLEGEEGEGGEEGEEGEEGGVAVAPGQFSVKELRGMLQNLIF